MSTRLGSGRASTAARRSRSATEELDREPRPRLRITTGALPEALLSASAVAIPVSGGSADAPAVGAGAELESVFGAQFAKALGREDAKGAPGEIVTVPVVHDVVETVYLAGIGDGSVRALRKAGAALVRRARSTASLATSITVDREPAAVRAVAEAMQLGAYRYRVPGVDPKTARLEQVTLAVTDPAYEREVDASVAVARAVWLARDLANTPSLEKSPAWLAEAARAAAERHGVAIRVRDEAELAEEGFGGILAVGSGSVRPPRLIELTYAPRGARRHVVLIGKGITFDSGGLSLKPNDGMVAMKTDMAGGAAVIATMTALRDLGVPVKVTGLVPAAENLPSGTAVRPGDVLRHYGGRTTEVLNTDAEGRVVLGDALAYADRRLRPDAMVDIATLTGAASRGLGKRHGALYASDDALAEDLLTAAEAAGERLWRMPLVGDYRACLDSGIADMANVSRNPHVQGGSIIAALFLREFTGGRPWAHLDVAGPARADADEDEVTKGATGYGVRLLLRWLEGQREAASA
jgi:leucyl aminopeptidase